MSKNSIQKVTLRFGQSPMGQGAQQGFINAGLPGPVDIKGVAILDGTGNGGGWSDVNSNPVSSADVNTMPQTAMRLALDNQSYGAMRGISAIAIAPDSPVHSCDLWFGGESDDKQKFRISPGNPLIADLSQYQECYVSPVAALGRDDTAVFDAGPTTLAEGVRGHLVWDGNEKLGNRHGPNGDFQTISFAWPLRLELYFDGQRPERNINRAEYRANAQFILTGSGTGLPGANTYSQEASLTVCIDGRSEVDVIAMLTQARTMTQGEPDEVTIKVFGGDAYPQLAGGGTVPAQLSVTENYIAWTELDGGTVLVDPTNPGPGAFYGETNARPVRYAFTNKDNRFTFLKLIVSIPLESNTLAIGAMQVNCYD